MLNIHHKSSFVFFLLVLTLREVWSSRSSKRKLFFHLWELVIKFSLKLIKSALNLTTSSVFSYKFWLFCVCHNFSITLYSFDMFAIYNAITLLTELMRSNSCIIPCCGYFHSTSLQCFRSNQTHKPVYCHT